MKLECETCLSEEIPDSDDFNKTDDWMVNWTNSFYHVFKQSSRQHKMIHNPRANTNSIFIHI